MIRRTAAAIACLLFVLPACGSGDGPADFGSPTELTVFAASSLTGAFTQIAKDFHGATITFDFGSSTDLAAQIGSEGGADVFASASTSAMDDVARNVGVAGRVDFARNELVVITPVENPAGIGSLDDLADPGVQVVLAATGVPVGDYARQALEAAGIATAVEANVVSNEEDDASVVAKITAGEADAGIVYRSDVTSAVAPQVHAIEIPADVNVLATYPIAVVQGSAHPDLARAFIDAVTGPAGRATLKAYGFLPVPSG